MASKPDSVPELLRALEFAARKRRDQRRSDASASPYINHAIGPARLLTVEGGAGDTTCRQLLHERDVHTRLRLPTDLFYAQA